MRKFDLDITEYQNCCQITIVSAFPYKTNRKATSDEEWFSVLCNSFDEYYRDPLDTPLITFAHSNRENRGPASPKAFAAWLTSKGEEVQEVQGKHRNRDSHIILYTCALSPKFWKELKNYKKKVEDAADNDNGDDN